MPMDSVQQGSEREPHYGGPPAEAGTRLAEISNAMVRLYKEHFGRGPTRARAYFADANTLLCLLEDSFTPAERNLAAMGEHQRLRDIRLFFQHATEREFRATVEEITGRRVASFISGMDTNTDTSAELFILEPADVAAGDGSG
jgi:uncharacterized protein YbcI